MFLSPGSTEVYGSCHLSTEDVQTHAIQPYFFVVRFEALAAVNMLGYDTLWTQR
jgi:hypothetical protein